MKIKKIFLILTLLLSFSNITYAASNNALISEDNRIIAYKEVNAVRLTLSDGKIFAYSSLDKTITQESSENVDPLEIFFILDCSGSMNTNGRMNQLKIASIALVTKLHDLVPSDKLSIGLIPFNSAVITDQVLNLTNNLPVIINHINSLSPGGGTQISGAISLATSKFSEEPNVKRIIVTVTDGSVSDTRSTEASLSIAKDKGSIINSIFFDLPPQPCFTSVVPAENVYTINSSSGDTIYETMVNHLYDSIYSELVQITEQTTTNNSHNVSILPNESLIITVDDELMHGATLEIEYIFRIQLLTDCKSVSISDQLTPELSYSKDDQLLTDDKINEDYHWQFEDNLLTYTFANPEKLKKDDILEQKVIVSTTLTPDNPNNRFENTSSFKIIRNDTDEEFSGSSSALTVLILPPFGKNTFCLPLFIPLIILVIVLLIFLKLKK